MNHEALQQAVSEVVNPGPDYEHDWFDIDEFGKCGQCNGERGSKQIDEYPCTVPPPYPIPLIRDEKNPNPYDTCLGRAIVEFRKLKVNGCSRADFKRAMRSQLPDEYITKPADWIACHATAAQIWEIVIEANKILTPNGKE
jgi:hypothetical protein